MKSPLSAAVIISGCACGALSHLPADVGPTDAWVGDAPGTDSTVEPPQCLAEGAFDEVSVAPMLNTTLCTSALAETCRRSWQALAPPGTFARSTCERGCTVGDACVTTTFGIDCACDGVRCSVGELCVSDSPRGPARCVRACARETPPSSAECDASGPAPLRGGVGATTCTPAAHESCQQWFQAFTLSGAALGTCRTDFDALHHVCFAADHCELGPRGACTCGEGPDCAPGEVCVLEDGAATPHCAPGCVFADPAP